jgi:hypothetical protein
MLFFTAELREIDSVFEQKERKTKILGLTQK